jgi:predicted secreted protein
MAEPAGFGYADGGRAAIISVYSLGFEGPDRRFIAVPIPNP